MNLKIACACGQHIAFDVEPENGQMPCSIQCPSCQTDVTSLANAEIQKGLVPVPPPPTAAPRLRVNVAHHAPAPAPASAAEAATPPPPAETPTGRPSFTAPPPPAPVRDPEEGAPMGKFLLGIVGVVVGAVLGVAVWVMLAKVGLGLRLVAVLVGVGAGFGGRVFCREGDKGLGGIAAVVAVLAMFFGAGLVFNEKVVDKVVQELDFNEKELREMYDDEVKEAKALVAQIPNGTDAEIRAYLVKESDNPSEVTDEDVKLFKVMTDLTEAKDMASGKITFAAYSQKTRAEVKEFKEVIKDATKKEQGTVAAVGMIGGLRLWMIALVGGAAYKIAAG